MRRAALLAALALAGLACDPAGFTAPAPGACREAGAQCPLEGGALGVCERAPCGPGAAEPCFACTPQH